MRKTRKNIKKEKNLYTFGITTTTVSYTYRHHSQEQGQEQTTEKIISHQVVYSRFPLISSTWCAYARCQCNVYNYPFCLCVSRMSLLKVEAARNCGVSYTLPITCLLEEKAKNQRSFFWMYLTFYRTTYS